MSKTIPDSDRAKAYFEYIKAINPPAFRVWMARNEKAFFSAVEGALEMYVFRMQTRARQYFAHSELDLSSTLADLFWAGGVPAAPEAYHNGHVDVVVTHPTLAKLTLLGECKIYGGYELHLQGCRQMLERYMTGMPKRGFCLDFYKIAGMYEKLRELRVEFDQRKPLRQTGLSKPHSIEGAFLTGHIHFTKAECEILHLGCNVFHPESPSEIKKK